MKIEIKSWLDGKLLFETDAENLSVALQAAVKAKIDLSFSSLDGASLDRASLDGASLNRASLNGANLDGASLNRASLVGASLDGASLDGASLDGASLNRASLDRASLDRARLVGASLVGASLDRASLDGARLVGARLDRASLDGARLDGASLDGARLVGARLVGASLVGARLVGARLDHIKHDFWAVLMTAPAEALDLRQALVDGLIEGSAYTGECACLIGTIANLRGVHYKSLGTLRPDCDRHAERWFLGIKKGDTPETHQISKITVAWLDEWLALAQAFPNVGVPA